MLSAGSLAPSFSLLDAESKKVSLSDFRGKFVILYFYPKDNSFGCSIEAETFTKLRPDFDKENAVIIGVSKDSCASHLNFIASKKLNLILLSDPDNSVQKLYGVYRPKKFMGKEFLGTARVTFLINPKKIIEKIWDPVNFIGHASDVLDSLREIKSKIN